MQRDQSLSLSLSPPFRHLFTTDQSAEYPDMLALTFDPVARHLTCVYNDHSVYVWDVRDIRNVGKVYSALYHSGCVWSLEVCSARTRERE